jgi:tyrosine-specific transport protein
MINIDLYDKKTFIPSIFLYIILMYLITFHKNKILKKFNSILSIILFIAYIFIIFKCLFYIKIENIMTNNITNITNLLTLAITSFGFAIIIPTLSDFLKKKYNFLYKSISLGSLITLIIYIIWIIVMLGVFPLNGEFNLQNISNQKISPDLIFTNFISRIIDSNDIIIIIKVFAFIAIITSLIGVATSLKDFLSDERILNRNNIIILLIIIFPPILSIMYLKYGFISILKISGVLVSILLGIMPTITVWHGRYNLKIESKIIIPGGKKILAANCIFFLYAIINDVIN